MSIVRNVHQRAIAAPPTQVGRLLDTLASTADRLWPHERWPPLKLNRPLGVGAAGGHGPIRYTVEAHEPGECVVFRFTGPPGFDGTHRYEIEPQGAGTLLRHVIEMRAHGTALLTWPLLYRPLHDALMEDSLSKAEATLAGEPTTGSGIEVGIRAAPSWETEALGVPRKLDVPRNRIMSECRSHSGRTKSWPTA